jgi:hypothetical protein
MPNIKQSLAKSPAKTKAVAVKKAAATEPFSVAAAVYAPPNDPNHARAYFTPAELSRTHELIVDAVTTMLSSGGHPGDVDSLLYAAMAHTRRRTYGGAGLDDQKELDKRVSDFVHDKREDWKHDLVAAWRKNKREETGAFEPKSITDRIRFNVRESLIGEFDSFMGDASPEEQRFMLGVFNGYFSNHHPAEHGSAELFIAQAFEYQLGRDHCYLRVPEHMVDQVQKYVDALRAIEDKEVA